MTVPDKSNTRANEIMQSRDKILIFKNRVVDVITEGKDISELCPAIFARAVNQALQ